jgi:hypothetical protein
MDFSAQDGIAGPGEDTIQIHPSILLLDPGKWRKDD